MSEPKTAGQQQATKKDAVEHLALVRSLSHEISSAISAIERNDRADLSERVAAQEAICLKLNQKSPTDLQLACASYRATSEQSEGEPSLWQKIREAHIALDRVNRVYAALIKRSQKSIEMIVGLYRNPGPPYAKDEGAPSPKHTWSCEA